MTSSSKTYSTDDLELFETHRKSPLIAYATLLLTGALGGHRHYLGYSGTGFIQTLLGLTAVVSAIISWPYVQSFFANPESTIIADDETLKWVLAAIGSFVLLGLWLVLDMFRIPMLAARKNRDLISRLASVSKTETCPTDIIAKFAALRANGTISEEEFIACKQQIMGLPAASRSGRPDGNSSI